MNSDSCEVADNEAKELDTRRDEVPMALCVVGSVSKQASTKPLVVLFDSGASHTWWNIKCTALKAAESFRAVVDEML